VALSRTGASPVIVWFRNDLRLTDNPALAAACDTGRPVIPLYILIEGGAGRPLGAASRWWLDKSLRSLAKDIVEMGGRLILRRGHAQTTLLDVVKAGGASAVYWNRRYEPGAQDEDRAIKEALGASGVEVREFNAALLSEPWDISTGSGGPYKVFSAYWRSAAPIAGRTAPLLRPRAVRAPADCVTSEDLDAWRLHPRHPDWSGGLGAWSPGEAGAHERLHRFLDGPVNTYAADRDRPDLEGTSRLSPHLRFGEIGPRQVWHAAQARLHERHATRRGVETFLKELGWREFNYQLLHNFPNTVCENLDPKFDAFPWRDSEADLEAWRRGRTGYPLVDAGMRQLWATGWMHNRVRMVVASFLVKDLLIDWRAGEATRTWPIMSAAGSGSPGRGPTPLPTSVSSTRSSRPRDSIRRARTCAAGFRSLRDCLSHVSTGHGRRTNLCFPRRAYVLGKPIRRRSWTTPRRVIAPCAYTGRWHDLTRSRKSKGRCRRSG
jgi:deoxyribodipyrimidine photo-lyase